jgi:hypothetical protein
MLSYDQLDLPFALVRRIAAWQREFNTTLNLPDNGDDLWWNAMSRRPSPSHRLYAPLGFGNRGQALSAGRLDERRSDCQRGGGLITTLRRHKNDESESCAGCYTAVTK